LLCILQKTNGEVKLGFNGDLYPTAGASVVMTTSGDMVKYQSGARTRLGIGSANQILQVKSSLPSWETVDLADTVLTTAGDVLYENATPELARLGAGTQYNNLQMGASLPAWSASSTSVLTGTGDVLYSSGANTLARLAIGSTNDVLTVAGGVPTWSAPSGGGAISFLEEFTLGSSATSFTGTLSTPYVLADFECLICEAVLKKITNAAPTQLQWNGNTTYYTNQAVQIASGTVTGVSELAQPQVTIEDNAGVPNSVTISIRFYENPENTVTNKCFYNTSCDTDVCRYGTCWRQNSGTDISEIKFLSADANIEDGARMRLYTMAKS